MCWPGIVSAPSFTEAGLLLLTGKMDTLCSQLRLVRSSSLVSWPAWSAGSWASQLACSLLARWWVGRLMVTRMWRQSGVFVRMEITTCHWESIVFRTMVKISETSKSKTRFVFNYFFGFSNHKS